ncbi:MAG: hypothetical protein AABY46_08305 [Nitrospirota bacterium]
MSLTSYGFPAICDLHEGALVIYDRIAGGEGCPVCFQIAQAKDATIEALAARDPDREAAFRAGRLTLMFPDSDQYADIAWERFKKKEST